LDGLWQEPTSSYALPPSWASGDRFTVSRHFFSRHKRDRTFFPEGWTRFLSFWEFSSARSRTDGRSLPLLRHRVVRQSSGSPCSSVLPTRRSLIRETPFVRRSAENLSSLSRPFLSGWSEVDHPFFDRSEDFFFLTHIFSFFFEDTTFDRHRQLRLFPLCRKNETNTPSPFQRT